MFVCRVCNVNNFGHKFDPNAIPDGRIGQIGRWRVVGDAKIGLEGRQKVVTDTKIGP